MRYASMLLTGAGLTATLFSYFNNYDNAAACFAGLTLFNLLLNLDDMCETWRSQDAR